VAEGRDFRGRERVRADRGGNSPGRGNAATGQRWVLLSVALVLTCAAEAVIRHSFVWFAVLITPLSILLTNVLVPGDWHAPATRTQAFVLRTAVNAMRAASYRLS
jgi:hypothetical protein